MRCVSEDKEAYVESNSERRNSEKRKAKLNPENSLPAQTIKVPPRSNLRSRNSSRTDDSARSDSETIAASRHSGGKGVNPLPPPPPSPQ